MRSEAEESRYRGIAGGEETGRGGGTPDVTGGTQLNNLTFQMRAIQIFFHRADSRAPCCRHGGKLHRRFVQVVGGT